MAIAHGRFGVRGLRAKGPPRLLTIGAVATVLASAPMGANVSAALPDGRAYELVSPVAKNGGDVMMVSSRTRGSSDGDALGFGSLTGFGDVIGTATSVDYLARREANGWVSHAITPRQQPVNAFLLLNGPGDMGFEGELSADLSRGVVRANQPPGVDPNVAAVPNLFVRRDLLVPGPGALELVTPSVVAIPPPLGGTDPGYKPYFADASVDFTHVIFESTLNLTQEAIDAGLPTGSEDFKLYESVNGVPRLVGVLPPEEGGGLAVPAVAGQGAGGINPFYTQNTISDDGSRIFFTVREGQNSISGQLYVREDGARTVRINVSEKASPDPSPGQAVFRAATPDGAYVFFTSAESLTDDDDNGVVDLYRADLNAPAGARLRRLSIDNVPDDGISPDVFGMLGVSDDGEWAYFLARGPLVPDIPGTDVNTFAIYAWHTDELRFVAKISPTGVEDRNIGFPTYILGTKTSRVSPDGRYAAFITAQEDQVVRQDHGECQGTPCRQVYVFAAEGNGGAGSLRCVSCAPGTGGFDAAFTATRGIGGSRTTAHVNRPLSADGHWVFFHTKASLVAEDENAASDVYEYDLTKGELRLISSGAPGGGDAFFLDASPSGHDVFFGTRERLVGWDVDGAYDAYDARVEGGFRDPVTPPAPCVGDDCKGPLRKLPIRPMPASATFRGEGNVQARPTRAIKRCKRGKVRRKINGRVRCVRKAGVRQAERSLTEHEEESGR